MKRFLHALAALWPKVKDAGRPPATPTSTGLRQHLAAVLRIEGYLSECTDIHSRKPNGLTSRQVERSEATVNRPERSDVRHPSRQVGSETVGIDDRNAVTPGTRPAWREVKRSGSPNQPNNLPRIPQPMPLLTILMLVFFMCLMAAPSRAIGTAAFLDSIPEAAIRPLQIGDTIPEELWHLPLQVVNHPEGKETITLNDYRGKLIILDFWATWCAPCISSLEKLDNLQDQFTDNLAVIPTTYEQSEKVAELFQEKGWGLPTATTERTLRKYFPYQSIPHQVWLKDGKLLAVAGPEYAHEEHIGKVLRHEVVDFEHKIEVPFDREKPLFVNGNGVNGTNLLYQSVISGRLDANVGGLAIPDSNQLLAYNQTVLHLYSIALGHKISPLYNQDYIRKYIMYEVSDTLKSRIDPIAISNASIQEKESWADENLYCYNLVLPNHVDLARRKEIMLRDLNVFFSRYLKVRADISIRQVRALSLIRSSDVPTILTTGADTSLKINPYFADKTVFVNKPISSLVHLLNSRLSNVQMPIVDKTGIAGNIDISLNLQDSDLGVINEQLLQYGLSLVESNECIDMIVFTTTR